MILFKPEHIQPILTGIKTQTRLAGVHARQVYLGMQS